MVVGVSIALLVAALMGVLSFGHSTKREAATGAALGALGGSLIMVAIGGCTFTHDAESTEGVLGVALSGAFGWMAGGGARAIFRQREKSSMTGEVTAGTFKIGWWWPWLLLMPTLIILVFFLYLPAYQTFTLSTKLTRLGAPRTADRCLSNFSELLVENPVTVVAIPLIAVAIIWGMGLWSRTTQAGTRSHDFSRALQPFGIIVLVVALYFIFENENGGYRAVYFNTLTIALATVFFSMTVGLGLAYLAYNRVRGITAYRTLLIWPYAISPPVAGILFFMMFNSTGGIFAALSERVGYDFPNYAESAFLARGTIVLSSVWKLLGYNLLFFLAGLQTVPRDQIEAAALDGASSWNRFRFVVLPALGPIAFFLLITNLTFAFFDVYGTIDFLTKGAPAGATSVAIYEVIRVGVDNGDLGRGAAQSVVLFLAVIALTAWQFRQSEGRVNYAGS